MATAKNPELSHGQEKGSAEITGYTCSPCTKAGKETRARKYCVDCGEFFCSECIEFHNRITTLSFHQILQDGNLDEFCRRDKPSFPTQRCARHHGRLLDTFCADHDVVCCTTCVSISHRNCDGIQYLPDVARGVKDSQRYKTFMSSVTECFNTLVMKEGACKAENETARCKTNKHITAIEVYTANMKAKLDDMKRNAIDIVQSECNKHEEKVNGTLERLGEIRTDLNEMMEKMSKNDSNESDVFVHAIEWQSNIKPTEKKLHEVEDPQTLTPFFLNLDINDMLNDCSIGWFGEYPVLEEYDIADTDNDVCDITGSCCCPKGGLVLADWTNKKLIKLSDKFAVTERFSFPNAPWAVCSISTDQIAVTFPMAKSVGLLRTEPSITMLSSFKVGKTCRGICLKDEKLYIGCEGKRGERSVNVQVYSLEGKHLSTLRTHLSHNILRSPMHLAASQKQGEVYVADLKTGIILIKVDGSEVEMVSEESLPGIAAVCVNKEGNIYASDSKSGRILRVSNDLKFSTEIVQMEKQYCNIQAIAFDESKLRLIIASEHSNKLLVCQKSITF